jgi:hypothetical protein
MVAHLLVAHHQDDGSCQDELEKAYLLNVAKTANKLELESLKLVGSAKS